MTTHKIIKCGLIGGLVLFIWGAIFWTFLPLQKNIMKSFSNESEVRSAIVDNTKGSGLYVLPNLSEYIQGSSDYDNAKNRMRDGPYATVAVMANGKNPNITGSLLAALIVKIVAVCLATWLLLNCSHAPTFHKSVKFITMVGVLVAIASTLPFVIWFGFPVTFAVGSIIETVIGWFLAGLIIAKMLSKKA